MAAVGVEYDLFFILYPQNQDEETKYLNVRISTEELDFFLCRNLNSENLKYIRNYPKVIQPSRTLSGLESEYEQLEICFCIEIKIKKFGNSVKNTILR